MCEKRYEYARKGFSAFYADGVRLGVDSEGTNCGSQAETIQSGIRTRPACRTPHLKRLTRTPRQVANGQSEKGGLALSPVTPRPQCHERSTLASSSPPPP